MSIYTQYPLPRKDKKPNPDSSLVDVGGMQAGLELRVLLLDVLNASLDHWTGQFEIDLAAVL